MHQGSSTSGIDAGNRGGGIFGYLCVLQSVVTRASQPGSVLTPTRGLTEVPRQKAHCFGFAFLEGRACPFLLSRRSGAEMGGTSDLDVFRM